MSASKVKCQCCGKLMVPTVLRTRGLFVGWKYGWFFGGGKPYSSCCPFCLSEEWDGKRDIRETMLWRHIGFILAVIAFFLIFMLASQANSVVMTHYNFDFGIFGVIASFAGAIGFYKWFTK
ncbi:hypothetical protein [Aquipseudomonas alcaligenes]|uniref:Uncharacterized protein n=1 Tax=Aquipseudomonas alcaligenes TaxID=43263 RepID=A0A1N6XFI6_AQUAC|nr:hypothetical protein [Pseudomonas alcaligenes]SIR01063.1 hypothetical protein SAMN05878282_112125 [Pseudomonas alcaligenes]